MVSFKDQLLKQVKRELPKHRNSNRAAGAAAYMKHIAPFLGVDTPTRRATLRPIFKALPPPTSTELGQSAIALMQLREREYHYAAYDLVDHFVDCADKEFLTRFGEELLTTKSWWDTVDGFGNAMVSPLTLQFPQRRLIEQWIRSENIWLVRAAIQHQRGRGKATDVAYVLQLCARHSDSNEFFIVKAIGWALRDISRFNKAAVRKFLRQHPELGQVAVREAKRYL